MSGQPFALLDTTPQGVVEGSWLHLCGTLPVIDTIIASGGNVIVDDVTSYPKSKWYCWELCGGTAIMVVAPMAMASLLLPIRQYGDQDDYQQKSSSGFSEFSAIYFSLVNGWLLYVSHFSARFQEHHSRTHFLLLGGFLFGLLGGIWTISQLPSAVLLTIGGGSIDAKFQKKILFQRFSLFMVLMRFSIFIMLTRVYCHVGHVGPFGVLQIFVQGDSILCHVLVLVSGDCETIVMLWTASAIIECFADLFLSIGTGNPNRLQVPYRLDMTLDHLWAVVLAPLGSFTIATFLNSVDYDAIATTASSDTIDVTDISIFQISAILLLSLFGLLYLNMKHAVWSHMRRKHPFFQSLLLLWMKVLGLMLWVVGASLWVLSDLMRQWFQLDLVRKERMFIVTNDDDAEDVLLHLDQEIHHRAILLGLSVGGCLLLLFGLRACTGRSGDMGEVFWMFAFVAAMVSAVFLPHQSTKCLMGVLAVDVLLVAFLSGVESWAMMEDNDPRRDATMAPDISATTSGELQRLISGEPEQGPPYQFTMSTDARTAPE